MDPRRSHTRTIKLDRHALERIFSAKYGRPVYMRMRVAGAPEMVVVDHEPAYTCAFWDRGQRELALVRDVDIEKGLVDAWYVEDRPDLLVAFLSAGKWCFALMTEGLRDDPELVTDITKRIEPRQGAFVVEVGYLVQADGSIERRASWRPLSDSGLRAAYEGKYDDLLSTPSQVYLIETCQDKVSRSPWPTANACPNEDLKTTADDLARARGFRGQVVWLGDAFVCSFRHPYGVPAAFYEVRECSESVDDRDDESNEKWVSAYERAQIADRRARDPGVAQGLALLERARLFGHGYMGWFNNSLDS